MLLVYAVTSGTYAVPVEVEVVETRLVKAEEEVGIDEMMYVGVDVVDEMRVVELQSRVGETRLIEVEEGIEEVVEGVQEVSDVEAG